MKQFRKTKEGLFICEECGNTYKQLSNLSAHISIHYSKQIYFDKFIKEECDGKCKICNKETKFESLRYGYKSSCSKKCSNLYKYQKTKETNMLKYGVSNPYQRKDIQEKIKYIHLNNLGVEYPMQSNLIKLKSENTCLINHGVKNVLQLPQNKIKATNSMINKYGVKYAAQNEKSFKKILQTRRQIKKFNNTNIYYQGSYELDFLEKFYDKIDIENGPSIPYIFEGKNKVYHSDFYIPSKNLIVEIKSSYILKFDKEIEYKKKACIENNYNYILIIDKNYKEFNLKI